jgi:hypothetical protein
MNQEQTNSEYAPCLLTALDLGCLPYNLAYDCWRASQENNKKAQEAFTRARSAADDAWITLFSARYALAAAELEFSCATIRAEAAAAELEAARKHESRMERDYSAAARGYRDARR